MGIFVSRLKKVVVESRVATTDISHVTGAVSHVLGSIPHVTLSSDMNVISESITKKRIAVLAAVRKRFLITVSQKVKDSTEFQIVKRNRQSHLIKRNKLSSYISSKTVLGDFDTDMRALERDALVLGRDMKKVKKGLTEYVE